MLRLALVLALVGCNSERYHTQAFVSAAMCGQGPYEFHVPADGTTAEDGIEVVACTPRRLTGHVQFTIDQMPMANQAFGDVADNQRCVASGATVTAVAAAAAGPTTSGAGSGSATAAPQTLIEEPYTGDESPFEADLCKGRGLTEQTILMSTVYDRYRGQFSWVQKGSDMRVRIWSDAPNDLSNVVFFVRALTSTHAPEKFDGKPVSPAETKKILASMPAPAPPSHGPPPAPLVEERPSSPVVASAWVPGYWMWTGAQWGWIAGFWRDPRGEVPAPRAEVPGAAPAAGAIWVGGVWQRRQGSVVWIGGHWRR
jgi:hypothetical protein